MLDWLKTVVFETAPAPAVKPDRGRSRVWLGKKVYPVLSLDRHGFVADRFDGVLEPGQRAKVEVHVDDLYGSFRFTSLVTVTRTANTMFAGAWWMMLPETRLALLDYERTRQQALATKQKALLGR